MNGRFRALGDEAQEAIEELVACVEQGWTGELIFDFRSGVPHAVRRTDRKLLGAEGRPRLTAEGSSCR